MKLIICEGGDNLGKSTLIEGLCKYLKYDTVMIRHFGKPPKGMSPAETLDFQFKCFDNEARFLHKAAQLFTFTRFNYYPNTFIWNRSHIGEYVYGQMFRGSEQKEILNKLLTWEDQVLKWYRGIEIYLITHDADPEFFLKNEDGDSYAKTLEDKTKELKLFKEIHELSHIKNKLLIKVDENGKWRPREDVLNEVLKFIQ